jgi:hypothetical protein
MLRCNMLCCVAACFATLQHAVLRCNMLCCAASAAILVQLNELRTSAAALQTEADRLRADVRTSVATRRTPLQLAVLCCNMLQPIGHAASCAASVGE